MKLPQISYSAVDTPVFGSGSTSEPQLSNSIPVTADNTVPTAASDIVTAVKPVVITPLDQQIIELRAVINTLYQRVYGELFFKDMD